MPSSPDTAQSDIDVMLIGENLPLGDILEHLLPLEAQLGRKINPTCYTPVDFERRTASAVRKGYRLRLSRRHNFSKDSVVRNSVLHENEQFLDGKYKWVLSPEDFIISALTTRERR
jgi:hypothetical protein